jgi:alpha,alpha-trehalase
MLGYASPLDFREEIDARSGRHLGNLPAGTSPTWSSSTSMHVVRADHELAAAQPLLGTRRGVPAT